MYDDHYGLTGRPFQLTPDPRFWFDTVTHRKAMAYLGYGLAQGEGFIVITGDVGAGKTTLVGHLMGKVDPTQLHVIKIVSTQIEAEDLLRMVATGLEIESEGMTKAQILLAIERGLHAMARSGRRTLLIVDEAQALPVASLEELRMLSNFQTGGHALLQIFLLGQPEFRERLHGSDRLEQLRQRVIAMHHLDPMAADEVEPYMLHRLSVVGWQGRPHFTPEAFAALYAGSDGVPRRLNQLAGRVLLYGAIEQRDTIDAAAVATVINDIAGDMPGIRPVAVTDAPEPEVTETPVDPEPVVEEEPVEAEPVLEEEPETAQAEPAAVSVWQRPEAVVAETLPAFRDPVADAIEEVEEAQPVEPARFLVPAPQEVEVPDVVPEPAAEPECEPEPEAAPEPEPKGEIEPEPETEAKADPEPEVQAQPDLAARVAKLEARVEEQDVALRRVLTLLVHWAEGEVPGTAQD